MDSDLRRSANAGAEPVQQKSRLQRTLFGIIFGFLLPVVVLGSSALVAMYLLSTKPQAQMRPPQRNALLVEITEVQPGMYPVIINAMGTVKPAVSIRLQSRVSGQDMSVADKFVPAGVFKAGETILKIDPKDYELAIRESEAGVAKAESALKIEQGMQSVAQKEYELLNESVSDGDSDWVLRKPQLQSAQAALDAAAASLAQAKLDLERTNVTAPFNAIVLSKDVDRGTQVSTSTPLATLVGVDEYWITVNVPESELKWINLPRTGGEKGSAVRVYNKAIWGPGVYRDGLVIQLLNELEPEGRMAQLLVSVPDPMGLDKSHRELPQILISSYVSMDILGKQVENVFAVDRQLINENDEIFVMDEANRLDIRKVSAVYRDKDNVYISEGIKPGDRLVTSTITAPVQGMALRIGSGAADTKSGQGGEAATPAKPEGKAS